MPSNIIIFFTDDHAQWALPCHGNSEIIAPSLDHLANTGIRMDNAFTPTPVCSPARASFWTGLYPSQHGVHDHLAEPDEEVSATPWLAGLPTLAELLHDAGYETGLCGKWHCGLGEVPKPGFDYWFSAWRQTPKYFSLTSKYSDQGDVQDITGYDTQIITDAAVRFLRQRDEEKPFFLFVGYATTHSPWKNRPERLVDHYRSASFSDIPDDTPYPFAAHNDHPEKPDDPHEAAAQYYAAVTQMDEMIGRLLDELDAHGARDDTLVIYTSDHGLNLGHHQVWGKGNGTVLINMLDESVRVPMILNQPGTLPPGQVRTEFVNHTDLFMTLLDIADALPGGKVPSPGRSFKQLLTVSAHDIDWENVQISEYGNVRMIRTPDYKLVRFYPDGPALFFDMNSDPRETINRFDDPAFASVIQAMDRRLADFFAHYDTPEHSGLNAPNLPKHNAHEAWRDRVAP